MDEYRMARTVLMAEVSGGGYEGDKRLGWIDGVNVALGNRGTTWSLRVNALKTQVHFRMARENVDSCTSIFPANCAWAIDTKTQVKNIRKE